MVPLVIQALESSSVEPLVRAVTHEPTWEPSSYDPDLDPAITDPDKFALLLENDLVRVLRCRVPPGERTHPHSHPDSIYFSLAAFRRRLTYDDGTSRERDFAPGEVTWLRAETHVCENVGTSATDLLIVEFKSG